MKRCESLLLSKIRAEKEICNLENWSAVSKAPCDPLFSPFFVYFLWLAQVEMACCTLHTRRCPYFVQKPFHHRKSCNFVQHSWCARDQNWQYFAKLCPKIQKCQFLYFSLFHCQKATWNIPPDLQTQLKARPGENLTNSSDPPILGVIFFKRPLPGKLSRVEPQWECAGTNRCFPGNDLKHFWSGFYNWLSDIRWGFCFSKHS